VEAFGREPFEAEGRGPLPIGVSVGVANHPGDGRTPTELIAAADERLYRIKRDGGEGVGAPTPEPQPLRKGAGAA
jgi:GGDEF domain-containing protein